MRLSIATPIAYNYACKKFHYAKAIPVVKVAFNVFNDEDEWCGVIIYGSGANPQIAMPYDKWQGQVLELVRVALNGRQKHGETSKAVGLSLKMLKKMYPWVDLIVSYADLDQNHIGTLYQSTNWIYEGVKNIGNVSAFIIKGKKMHTRSVGGKGWKQSLLWLKENVDKNAEEFITKGKYKYLYPMTKEMSKRVKVLSKEYPKKI